MSINWYQNAIIVLNCNFRRSAVVQSSPVTVYSHCYTHTHAHTHPLTHAHTHTHIRTHTHPLTHTHTHTLTHTHTYTHPHTQTHTHTHTQRNYLYTKIHAYGVTFSNCLFRPCSGKLVHHMYLSTSLLRYSCYLAFSPTVATTHSTPLSMLVQN